MVSVTHLFTSDGNTLSIGDNVVVVWPRISSGPVFPPQEVINKGMASFYLAEPLRSIQRLVLKKKHCDYFPTQAVA
jgi:hypothetical protein